jgi:uncharacterized protein YbcI
VAAIAFGSRVREGIAMKNKTQLAGGELLSAISTRIVAIMRKHYGKGPMKAKTYVLDDLVVCVLRNGTIPIEQTMIERGESDRVVQMRHNFQKLMGREYKEAIEELTNRKVIAFLSQAHVNPDVTLEAFLMDAPLPGFGAIEVLEAEGAPEGV